MSERDIAPAGNRSPSDAAAGARSTTDRARTPIGADRDAGRARDGAPNAMRRAVRRLILSEDGLGGRVGNEVEALAREHGDGVYAEVAAR